MATFKKVISVNLNVSNVTFQAPFVRGRSSSERRRSVRDPTSPAPARTATTGTAASAARPPIAGTAAGASAASQLQPQASTKQSKKDLLSSNL